MKKKKRLLLLKERMQQGEENLSSSYPARDNFGYITTKSQPCLVACFRDGSKQRQSRLVVYEIDRESGRALAVATGALFKHSSVFGLRYC